MKTAYEIINKTNELQYLGKKYDLLKGELKISATSIFFTSLLPEVLYSFKQQFPKIQVIINEDDAENIIRSVKENQFDIGLIAGPNRLKKELELDNRLRFHSLLQSNFMVCVGKNMEIAYNKHVTPEELIQYPLVIRNDKNTKNLLKTLFSRFGEYNVLFFSNNNDVIRNVIANNLAIGIYTDFWLEQDPLVKKGEIIPVPLEFDEMPISNLLYVQAKDKHTSTIEKEFLKFLTVRFDEYKSKNLL